MIAVQSLFRGFFFRVTFLIPCFVLVTCDAKTTMTRANEKNETTTKNKNFRLFAHLL